jgi:L-seryl-tRNA(Ser) seleniumtransferase
MSPARTRNTASGELRKLPKADRLLESATAAGFVGRLGHEAVMEAVRATVEEVRQEILGGRPCPEPEAVEDRVRTRLKGDARGGLKRVINATGVVIHTNLGRAPLSREAIDAMTRVAGGYSNLEYDLEAGERGSRYDHCARSLCRLTGAEAAVVVNNNAASVLVVLAALAKGSSDPAAPLPEVVISRGQLVEIGGGFRIPDVMRQSGAKLVEVGTTNRTYVNDYEAAITPQTRMLLSVHRSNFKLSGFVHDASLDELVGLARSRGLAVVDDLGSGTLLETRPFGLGDEPRVQERVKAGADVVCFSGDKLLGAPQAGILVGRKGAIEIIRKHPLMRALRVDKVTLAGLAATLGHYERGEAVEKIPIWRAISQRPDQLAARAEHWRGALAIAGATVVESVSAVGGGSLPDVTLPTRCLSIPSDDPDALAARLRQGDAPVVARIEDGRLLLDPRTVMPGEDDALLMTVLAGMPR